MTNKFNLKQGIKKYYPLGLLFLIIFAFILIQEAKAKEISVGTASDNIGIGTSAPGTTYRLNVNGNSNITGTLNVTGGITGSSLGATLLSASNVSAGTFGSNSGGGNYTFPGSVSAGTGASGGFRTSTYTAGQNLIWAFGNALGYGFSYKQGTVDDIRFHFGDFNNPQLLVNQNGYVGIGTAAPGAKLHVMGNDNQIAVDTTSEGSAGIFLRQSGVNQWEMYDYQDKWHLYNYGTAADAITVLQSNSNVGIGTVSPKQKLDVIGNVGIGAVASNFSDEGPNLHIWTSDVPVVGYGVGGANPANILIEENDSEQSFAFLGTNSATQKIVFGRTADSGAGQISFNHNTSQYNITGGNVNAAGTFTAGNMGGANLVPDSTNMSAYNASLASLTFVDGKTIQALDSPQTGSGSCYQWGSTAMIPVNANNDYEFSIWVKANGIQNIYFGFFVYDSSRNQISSGSLANPYFHTASEQTNDGWVKITAHLRASATPHDSNYVASITSNKSGPNVSDYVMPTNTSYSMVRFGSCYGGTSTTGRVYMYNPVIREVSTLYDSNYGAIWSKFNGSDYNVGIGTSNPGAYKLNVNGSINATSITGAMSGTLNAANLSSGTFGSNTGGGEYTFPGKIYLNAAEGLGVYGIRGRNANEQIEMYNSVSIGSPNGWTSFPQAPNFGLSTYGGANFATNQGSVGIGLTGPGKKLDVAGDIRARGNIYTDNDYGNGLVGVYTSTRYQGVFSMGDAYKLPADGSNTGNLYGLAWSHPNAGGIAGNLNTHGLLVMENGTFLAAISGSIRSRDDMQSPIFYDRNDTSYYMDPNGTSRLNNVTITGSISGTVSNADTVDGWHRDDIRAWGNLTGKPTLPSSQEGSRYTTDYNSIIATGFFNGEATPANAPNNYGQLISARGVDTGLQIAGGYSSDNLYFRGWWSSGAGFSPWRTIIHSGNIGSQSVSYASSAGNSDTVDGYHVGSLLKWDTWDNGNYYGSDGNTYMRWAGDWLSNILPSKATHRGEGANYVDYSRYVYNNGAYSGSGWIEPSDLGVRYAGSAGSAGSSSFLSRQGDGDRNAATKYPNLSGHGIRFDFVGSGSAGTGGNYAGVMTVAPWSGTTASTGDASYQLAFGSTTSNGNGNPQLKIRNGIDTTWNGWKNIIVDDGSGNVNLGTGQITSGGFIYNSDVKLKKNITTIDNSLAKILQLRGVTFNWKKDNTPGVGLIAQEVEKVFPELVSEQNGIKSVQYGNLVAPLIEAVKEQQKEIQIQTDRANTQQQEIESMKAQIQILQAKN